MSDQQPTISELDIDRLVDGELSSAERRELLRALEQSPDGWRRCALAFVESQALSSELSAVVPPATNAGHAALVAPRTRTTAGAPMQWFALAASALIAFGLGSWSGGAFRAAPPDGVRLANAEPAEVEPPAAPDAALDPFLEEQPEIAAGAPQPADRPDSDVVTFWAQDESGERQSLRARLVEADELDPRFGVRFRSGVPDSVREGLEERGFRLRSKQRYAPLNTDDGRTFVVPVEDVQVTPARIDYL